MKKKPKKRCREETCCRSKILSKEAIPQYFYMPITQAAKEPNLGACTVEEKVQRAQLRASAAEEKVQGTHLAASTVEEKAPGAGS